MYIVFGYDSYYPAGGVNDLMGVFEDYETARSFLVHHNRNEPYTPYHIQIVKFEEGKMELIHEGDKYDFTY